MCRDCGQKFTDDRWEASTAVKWDRRDSHPHLCDGCEYRTLEAEQQAREDQRDRQEQERQHTQADQKAGSWIFRFRT